MVVNCLISTISEDADLVYEHRNNVTLMNKLQIPDNKVVKLYLIKCILDQPRAA